MHKACGNIEARFELCLTEIFSADNKHFAAERLGREPSHDDLCEHWELHGGRASFEKKYPWAQV